MTPNDRRPREATGDNHNPPSGGAHPSVIVTLTDEGDLLWSGQHLGPDIRTLLPAAMEYGWGRTVRAAYVPALRAALGGAPSDDVVALVAARFKSDAELDEFATSLGIPTEFDSWIGAPDEG
ncbi:MAG TPA: hypothetical protein VFN41_03120 [Candidatus Limnocylindrales bacterium]|nr:hypothetical protein [Candidatus Limnocylindrales bacterium]